jgi:hypothetical protein
VFEGIEFSPFEYTVSREKVKEFCYALNAEIPAENGVEFMPVGMLMFVTVQDPRPVFDKLGLSWTNTLYGGSKVLYKRPIRVGERLTGLTKVSDYKEVQSGNRKLGIFTLQTDYQDAEGHVVANEISNVIKIMNAEVSKNAAES